MADNAQQITDGFKKAVDAQMRYYQALGDVTTEYVKSLMGIWSDVKLPLNLGALKPNASSAATPAAATATPALVLEAERGQQARGVFMVENKLTRHVVTPVVTSGFTGPGERELRPTMRIEPGVVSLEPGARTLVHLIASINDEMVVGATYHGEISVPGLSDSRVPVVLRRRESSSVAAGAGSSRKKGKRRAPKSDDSVTT
ncbi:MAG: hypothetical protein ABJD07_09175 [Gemmatimonadaceae bacterium]